MKKHTHLFKVALAATIAAGVTMSACKSDDEPFVKPKISFEKDSYTVKESDKTLNVKIVLDKAYSEDIKVTFKLAGTAVDSVQGSASSTDQLRSDYSIIGKQREITIPKDATEGVIRLRLYSDLVPEGLNSSDKFDPETIEISIDDVSSDNIEITRNDDTKISVQQEDGLWVGLLWGVGDGENYTDVDMDLFLWAQGDDEKFQMVSFDGVNPYASASATVNDYEGLFLPTAIFGDGTYGLSCVYYAGTQTPMNFVTSALDIKNAEIADVIETNGTYTLANINAYDVTKITPIVVQTFVKSGGNYSDFSEIDTPAANSRSGRGTFKLRAGFTRKASPFPFPVFKK